MPSLGQNDPCIDSLSVSPTTLLYNANGTPLTTFTITADPACFWYFQYIGGAGVVMAQPEGSGTVVFDPATNPLQGIPNPTYASRTEQFQVGSLNGSVYSATVTAIQDPGLTLASSCPSDPNNPLNARCTGTVGIPFQAFVVRAGGKPSYIFSANQNNFTTGLQNLGSGLTLDTSTGTISGTPTASGVAFFGAIYVKDSDGAIAGVGITITIGNATDCAALINNSLKAETHGANICATFTPNQGYTLSQAAQVCGFKDFDWIQQIIVKFDPSFGAARNLGGAYDPNIAGSVRLTSKRVPWSDPPQGGGYAPDHGGDPTPDNSYPFYYDQVAELAGHENGTPIPACSLAHPAGNTLTFFDAPGDPCLQGGSWNGLPICADQQLAPGAKAEPPGSFDGFFTHLAGVNVDGTATDLGIGFTWKSTNNGTSGGIAVFKTDQPADGNGTGGITVSSINQVTNYDYPNNSPQSMLLGGNQISATVSKLVYDPINKTLNGTVTITNISGVSITGPFQMVLQSLNPSVVLTNAIGSFGGYPFLPFAGLSSLAPGQSAMVTIQLKAQGGAPPNFVPLTYTGSLN